MKRIALFVVASMLLAACGSGGGAFVASVNDFDITLADVEALSPQAEDGSIDQTVFTQLLTNLIFHRAVVDWADSQLSVEASDDEIQVRVDEILAQFAPDQSIPAEDQLAEQNATLALVESLGEQFPSVVETRKLGLGRLNRTLMPGEIVQ